MYDVRPGQKVARGRVVCQQKSSRDLTGARELTPARRARLPDGYRIAVDSRYENAINTGIFGIAILANFMEDLGLSNKTEIFGILAGTTGLEPAASAVTE